MVSHYKHHVLSRSYGERLIVSKLQILGAIEPVVIDFLGADGPWNIAWARKYLRACKRSCHLDHGACGWFGRGKLRVEVVGTPIRFVLRSCEAVNGSPFELITFADLCITPDFTTSQINVAGDASHSNVCSLPERARICFWRGRFRIVRI